MNLIKWLEEWYKSQCDGDWEHFFGIKIETLDNPGWCVSIDITDTVLENKLFEEYEVMSSDEDWVFCRVKDGCFNGAGDPSKLEGIILKFKEWAEQ